MKPNSIRQKELWSEDTWSGRYSNITFYHCYWQDMLFDEAQFSHCTFYQCHWHNCAFRNTHWERITVYQGDMGDTAFEDNQLHNTTFQNTVWQSVRMINSVCLGVGFHHINLRNSGLDLTHCTECLLDHCDMATGDVRLQNQNRLTVLPSQTPHTTDPFLSQQQHWEQQHGVSI